MRRMTSAAAQRFSLGDRGLVRPGMVADLVLFEDSIDDRATFDSPTELPAGVCHVWVAGEAIVADGRITGRRPGRVLAETAGGIQCVSHQHPGRGHDPPGSDSPMR